MQSQDAKPQRIKKLAGDLHVLAIDLVEPPRCIARADTVTTLPSASPLPCVPSFEAGHNFYRQETNMFAVLTTAMLLVLAALIIAAVIRAIAVTRLIVRSS